MTRYFYCVFTEQTLAGDFETADVYDEDPLAVMCTRMRDGRRWVLKWQREITRQQYDEFNRAKEVYGQEAPKREEERQKKLAELQKEALKQRSNLIVPR